MTPLRDSEPGSAGEAKLRELVRQAGSAPALTGRDLDALWKKTAPRLGGSALGGVLGWLARPAIIAAVGAALLAALWGVMRSPTERSAVPAPANAPIHVAVEPETTPPAPVLTEPLVTRPPPSSKRAPRVEQREAEPEDPLLAESRLLAKAMAELREQHAARAALTTLDGYAVAFPQGTLASEARLLRIEALMSSGDRAAALALLEATPLDGLARGDELHVLEAELLAEAGRCGDALEHFGAAASAADPDLAQRSLFGRARCEGPAAARRDLEQYLQRFPEGRFAPEVRRQLGEKDEP